MQRDMLKGGSEAEQQIGYSSDEVLVFRTKRSGKLWYYSRDGLLSVSKFCSLSK